MIKFSIIIPVYNDKWNIPVCLDSLLEKQDLKDIEVICVDDGSADGSGEILESYSRKYSNLILIKQKHLGLSAARNAGLGIAAGKYVYFVDSDDIVEDNMLSRVWDLCEANRLDVLFFSFDSFGDSEEMNVKYAKHIYDVKRKHTYSNEVISGAELHEKFWEFGEYYSMVWVQAARRDFLLKNNIRYSENVIFEDNLYTFQVLIKAERTFCVNEILYHKRIRENSITTNPESVLSVYSFLYTFIHMIHYFEGQVPADKVFQAVRKIGKIQESYAYMIQGMQKQLAKRYARLADVKKQELLQKCSSYEKSILEMVGRSFSVIIPMYNAERYIRDCIESVQKQTVQNIEIIVVDDGSTDGSGGAVQEMAKDDFRIRYYYQENGGSGVARNLGLANAHGDYLAFLDADDFYPEEDALEKMMLACIRYQVPICGSFRVELKRGGLMQTDFLKEWGDLPEEGILVDFEDYQDDFFFQSFIYEGEFIRKNQIHFPAYRRYQDPPFLLKAMDISGQFCVVPSVLHCYRKGHQNYAGNGKYIASNLRGIRDNLLLSEHKYDKLFKKLIWRIEHMFLPDMRNYWSEEVKEILCEINEIYKRQYPEGRDMEVLTKLLKDTMKGTGKTNADIMLS